MTQKLLLTAAALFCFCLSGCAADQSGGLQAAQVFVPNDSTIFSGKQSGETKRHADDWLGPIADCTFGFAILAIDQQACCCGAAVDIAGSISDDRHVSGKSHAGPLRQVHEPPNKNPQRSTSPAPAKQDS